MRKYNFNDTTQSRYKSASESSNSAEPVARSFRRVSNERREKSLGNYVIEFESDNENTKLLHDLYIKSISFSEWFNKSHANIHINDDETPFKWEQIIFGYMIDVANSPEDDTRSLYTSLLGYLSQRTGITPNNLDGILKKSQTPIKKESLKKFSINRGKLFFNGEETSLHVPRIPPTLLNKYENNITHVDLISLYLRYSYLGESTGYFWSVPQDIYTSISFSGNTNIKTLECFASPLNYVTNEFCSLYPEDMNLKYPDNVICKGNFFDVIPRLIRKKIARKLLFNPPYTRVMIEKSLKVLGQYLDEVEDGEVFALLPKWTDVMDFIKGRQLDHIIFDQNKFKLYSFSDRSDIYPPNFSLVAFSKSQNSTEILEKCEDIMMI